MPIFAAPKHYSSSWYDWVLSFWQALISKVIQCLIRWMLDLDILGSNCQDMMLLPTWRTDYSFIRCHCLNDHSIKEVTAREYRVSFWPLHKSSLNITQIQLMWKWFYLVPTVWLSSYSMMRGISNGANWSINGWVVSGQTNRRQTPIIVWFPWDTLRVNVPENQNRENLKKNKKKNGIHVKLSVPCWYGILICFNGHR